jgi:hypothetical protein
MLIEHHPIHLN